MITQQVVQQHTHVISTTILHDAESQHFSDTKEFYEVAVILYIKLGLTSLLSMNYVDEFILNIFS